MILLASYLPGEGCCLRNSKHPVERIECVGPYDYWRGFLKHWDSDEVIVNVEHDLEISDEHIDALLDCPHPLCSVPYPCHWITTGMTRDVFAVGNDRWHGQFFFGGGEEWANWSAIGLVKIAPEARIAPLGMARWARLEIAIEEAIKPPWHLHWAEPYGTLPAVTHHHW